MGGKIAFGTSNPDTTLISDNLYNGNRTILQSSDGVADGRWHLVGISRAVETSGSTLTLWVDGASKTTTSTNANSLTGQALNGFGCK